MATYNGEKYLKEQIFSILNQSYQNFRLLICDDQSGDETKKIVETFVKEYPDKIYIVVSDEKLGAKGNFSFLMQQAKADYIMFSDQDDVWMQDKIAKTYHRMKSLEEEHGRDHCLLVHTDLTVVNQECKVLGNSFWKYSNYNADSFHDLNRFLIQNVVTGCTVMINRPLLNLCSPVPKESLMHDWWVALVASTFGKIGLVKEATMLYRQHGRNTLGAKKFEVISFLKEGFKKLISNDKTFLEQTRARYAQSRVFLERYETLLNRHKRKMIKDYIRLEHSHWFKKRYLVIKHHFFRSGFLRNFVTLLFKL